MTDRAGHQTKRWKRSGDEPSHPREAGQAKEPGAPKRDPEDERGARHGYGTGNIQVGDTVQFETPWHTGGGEIVAMGKDGAYVHADDGQHHKVMWAEIRHRAPGGGGGKEPPRSSEVAEEEQDPEKPRVLGSQEPIPAEKFVAADYAKSHDQAGVDPEDIIARFPDDTKEKIEAAVSRLDGVEQTLDKYFKDEKWTAEREALHDQILFGSVKVRGKDGKMKEVPGLLTKERIDASTPKDGEAATFIALGGRGGSGKSQLNGLVYDDARCIVLDADVIKGMLPEYEGWNAGQLHEESSKILERALDECRKRKLNVVLDATMKSGVKPEEPGNSVLEKAQRFKDEGFLIEGHYMHLPRQEAAYRSCERFLNPKGPGRFVPLKVILGNTKNEANFDDLKKLCDAWSFHDNNVPKGGKPILISQYGTPKLATGSGLEKTLGGAILFVRRKRK